jgi:anaerobic selenocysteine-containing dehydrogenase
MSDVNKAIEKQELVKDSVCYMCTDHCPTKVHVRQGRATRIDMVDRQVADTCPRWRHQLDFVYHPERLKHPLKRVGERGAADFVPISWEQALDTTASKLQDLKAKYGAESVVFYISYTKEPRPHFHRLAHAFGSPNYCTESSNCFSATWLAAALTYGQDYGPLYLQSVTSDPATKCQLIWGSAIKDSLPRVWQEHLEARQRGVKLIVVDPRRTTIASMADLHLQLRPGTDGALALGLMNVIINHQLYDQEFVDKWTVGFDDLKKLAKEYPPDRVEQITGVPANKISAAAVLYATQKPAKLAFSPASTTHHSNGVQNHRAIILLPALTGNFEVLGGNRWHANRLPVNDITLHERIAKLPPGIGSDRFPIWTKLYREMQSNVIVDQIDSGQPYPIKAIFGAGLNTMYFPNYNRFLENLKNIDFLVVSEYFHTPATQFADIVLPIASWLERSMLIIGRGGYVSTPGYVRLVEPAIEPVGESWPEWKIFSELAKRLGLGHEFWDGDFERCLNHMLEPSGITVADLRKHPEGITYPMPLRPHKYYEKTGFQTPSGKVEISSSILADYGHEPLPAYKEPVESPMSTPVLARAFPLVLTSGARTVAFTHSQHRNITELRKIVPEPLAEINPIDAKPRGINAGDMLIVSSPRGSIRMKACVTDTILPGVIQIPHLWSGEANVNILVDDQNLDPLSGFAPFKSQLCQVSKG